MTRGVGALLRRYAAGEAAAVAPYIVGHRLLDLGAAENWVAATLRASERGWAPRAMWVCGVDVGAHRRAPGPYVVYDGTGLPFRDHAFDTTLVLLTLHHCPMPEAVLDEALRVTRRRLIVIESVWRTAVERFWLTTLDGRVNHLRHDGRMTPARNVRRPEQWRSLFQSRSLTIAHERWLGSRWERLVHHPLLFVLDIPESMSAEVDHTAFTTLHDAGAPSPAGRG